ncbi:DUF4870 domain-containing protein [Microbacterium sp. NPDC055683]
MTINPNDPQDATPAAAPVPPPTPQPDPQSGPTAPPPPGAYPPPGGYAPPAGYPAPGHGQGAYQGSTTSNLALNLWLSVFFSWIPALIFYLVEKDKVSPAENAANAGNLNFQLVRIIALVAAAFIIWIPVIGQLLYAAVAIGSLVIAILHAVNVPKQLAAGQPAQYMLTPAWIK